MAKIRVEQLSHYAVIGIALLALFVSIWQGRILQRHNKLSVKPYLTAEMDQQDSTLTVFILNEGFGPAIIQDAKFSFKNKTYDSLESLLIGSGEKQNRIGSWSIGKGTIIAASSKRLLVKVKGREIRGINVELEFASIYEEKEKLTFTF
jgi:hypothetical protein